jgi:hypothetical protein
VGRDRAVTFFNKIVKATHVRSRAAYRLKIIARARSISDRFLALISMLVMTLCDVIRMLVTNSAILNNDFFFW